MPFVRDNPLAPAPAWVGVSEHDKPEPSLMEATSAAFRLENMIGSDMASQAAGLPDFNKIDPTYNPFDDLKGYEDHADRFDTVYNPQAAAAVKADIDREKRDRDTMAAYGWASVPIAMGAAILDLPTLIPGGALVRAGKIGYTGIKSAGAVSAAAGTATAIQEAGLQATQQTRTAGETAFNIGGSVILGGLLGTAGAKFFTNAEWQRLGNELAIELADDTPNPAQVAATIVERARSAGAAAVEDIQLDDLGVGGPRLAQAVAKATAALKINPGVSTMFSPAKKTREVYEQMVDNPLYTKMNMEGRTLGPSAENLVKEYERGNLGQFNKSLRASWREAKKSGFEGTRDDFYARATYAARRGDVDPQGNEQVAKAAQALRSQIFDPLLREAQAVNLLPDDVTPSTALTYVTRMWNSQKLIAREPEFRDVARQYFRQEMARIPSDQLPDFVSKADMDDYIDEAVTAVFDKLTGRGHADVPDWIVPVKRGPLKERTFKIPDELVEQFLENDVELIARRYTRTMGAEVELARKFGRADMKDQLDAINKEYTDLAKRAETEKERLALDRRRKEDIANITAFRDMIRGTYRPEEQSSVWGKITRAALTWNYIRLLGGVMLSSATDAARVLGVHGTGATMREALPALVSNVRAAKIARQDARDLGAVADVVLQGRLATLADLTDPYRSRTPYEAFLSNASNVFTKATGLGWWNDTWKTIASVMTQNRMAKNALDWSKAGKREQAYMAYLGIDEVMAGRIAEQIKKHGIQEQGIWGANVSEWDDHIARKVWGAALNKDVDRTIVTKSVADTPLWMHSNWGKLIMQFKSFALASHQRVLIAGLQERPHRLAENMVAATAIGMMIGYLKYLERGDTENADRLLANPGLWIADGLDRTGILSIPFEASNTIEKLGVPFGITSGAQALAGDEDRGGSASRYASRNKLGAVLGPTAGIFQDLTTVAEQLSKGEFKESGANALMRQIPGGTLPGIRPVLQVGVKPWVQDALD